MESFQSDDTWNYPSDNTDLSIFGLYVYYVVLAGRYVIGQNSLGVWNRTTSRCTLGNNSDSGGESGRCRLGRSSEWVIHVVRQSGRTPCERLTLLLPADFGRGTRPRRRPPSRNC